MPFSSRQLVVLTERPISAVLISSFSAISSDCVRFLYGILGMGSLPCKARSSSAVGATSTRNQPVRNILKGIRNRLRLRDQAFCATSSACPIYAPGPLKRAFLECRIPERIPASGRVPRRGTAPGAGRAWKRQDPGGDASDCQPDLLRGSSRTDRRADLHQQGG